MNFKIWFQLGLALMLTFGIIAGAAAGNDSSRINKLKLSGAISENNAEFLLEFTLKTKKKMDFPLVSGEICELEGSKITGESTGFWKSAPKGKIFYRNNTYFLNCPKAGKYNVAFKFAAKVVPCRHPGSKFCFFSLPSAIERKLEIKFPSRDVELDVTNSLNLKKSDAAKDAAETVYTGILPPKGKFRAVWRRHIAEIKSKLITAAQSIIAVNVQPGTVKLSGVYQYRIIQGKLNELQFKLSPGLNILSVKGKNVQDWKISTKNKNQILTVKLSTPFTKDYALGIDGEQVLPDFPCTFSLPSVSPLNVLRTDGFLAFGTDKAVKLLINQVSGMTQVDNRAFPRVVSLKKQIPSRSLFTYRFSGNDYSLKVNAANIIPSFSAELNWVLSVNNEDLTCRAACMIDIKDSPLQELLMEYDPALTVNRVTGRQVVPDDYETFDKNGKRWLRITFRPGTIGKTDFNIYFEQNIKGKKNFSIPELRFDKAKAVRGCLLLTAGKGFTLKAESVRDLTAIHPGSAPLQLAGLQLAYRFKDQKWGGSIGVSHDKASIISEVFHLSSIGEGIIYGSSLFSYHISGAPVEKLRFMVSPEMKNLEFTGRNIEEWKKTGTAKDGCTIWELEFREKIIGDITLLATYEISLQEKNCVRKFGDIHTFDAEAETGFIVVSSLRNLRLSAEKLSSGAQNIELTELPEEYRAMITNPVLKTYRCIGGTDWAETKINAYPTEKLLNIIIDHAELTTRIDRYGEAVTTAEYRIKNTSRQFFNVRLPEKSKLWTVTVNGKRVRLSLSNGRILIPIPRHQNINQPIAVKITYAGNYGKLENSPELSMTPPVCESEIKYCAWNISAPDDFNISNYSGNLSSGIEQREAGITGMLRLLWNWVQFGMEKNYYPPLALLFIGGIVLLCSWRANLFKIFGSIVGCALIIGAIMILVRTFENFSLPCVNTAGTSILSLTRMFCPADEVLRCSFDVTDIVGFSMDKFTFAAIFGGGGVVCLVLAWFLPGRFLKALAIAAGITLGLVAGSNWIYFNIITSLALAAALPLFIIIGIWSVLLRKYRRAAVAALLLSALFLPSGLDADIMEISKRQESGLEILLVEYQAEVTKTGVQVEAEYKLRADREGVLELLRPPAAISGTIPKIDDLEFFCRDNSFYLRIKDKGDYSFKFTFFLPYKKTGEQIDFQLPVPLCNRNRATISTALKNLVIKAPEAVIFKETAWEKLTSATGSFMPGSTAAIRLVPRARNVKKETAQVYAKLIGLVSFARGFVEIINIADLQIAQGEIKQLTVKIPRNMGVTAVEAPQLGVWRYDEKLHQLELLFTEAQSGTCRINITTQIANCSLPYEVKLGVLEINGTSRQYGSLGLYSRPGVQIGVDSSKGFNRINNSDFHFGEKNRDAILKKTFRYFKPGGELTVKATAVEPELRVREASTINFDDERTTLSANLEVDITKAGVFSLNLSFPDDFEIDRLSGTGIQHWDEVKSGKNRKIIINFAQRMQGQVKLNLELSKLGKITTGKFTIPKIMVAGAKKLNGELEIKVERGVRMEVLMRQGLEAKTTRTGSETYRFNAYRFLLHRPNWRLQTSFTAIESWIQLDTLSVAKVAEGYVSNESYLAYNIQNAGVKKLRFKLPEGAEAPEFTGRDITGIRELKSRIWEIELSRKVTREYQLKIRYRRRYKDRKNLILTGIDALNADLQTGYLAVFAEDSLQLKPEKQVGEITDFDPRRIPMSFRAGNLANSVICRRTIGKDWQLHLGVELHKPAKTLKAEINQVDLVSVLSAKGMLITKAAIAVTNGNERFLRLKLPERSRAWSVMVDGRPVNAAMEKQEMLVPLLQNFSGNRSQSVDVIYSLPPGSKWDFSSQKYAGPEFALPLKKITWKLFLPKEYRYSDFDGTLYTKDDIPGILRGQFSQFSLNEYDRSSKEMLQVNLSNAKSWLAKGNKLAKKGKQHDAFEAYQNALNLADNNNALYHDIHGQMLAAQRKQSVMAIAKRRGELNQKIQLRQQRNINQTQNRRLPENSMDFRQMRNLQLISDKLFKQQSAATQVPHPIQIEIPQFGKMVTFERMYQTKVFKPMEVSFSAGKPMTWQGLNSWVSALGTGIVMLMVCYLLTIAFGRFRTAE